MATTDGLGQFIEELRRRWPVARGSLCEVAKPCGRPHCAACGRGEKHPSFILSYRKGGTQRCLYVPRDLVAPLRRAIEGGRWLESRMAEVGARLVFAHRARRKAKPPRRKARTPKR